MILPLLLVAAFLVLAPLAMAFGLLQALCVPPDERWPQHLAEGPGPQFRRRARLQLTVRRIYEVWLLLLTLLVGFFRLEIAPGLHDAQREAALAFEIRRTVWSELGRHAPHSSLCACLDAHGWGFFEQGDHVLVRVPSGVGLWSSHVAEVQFTMDGHQRVAWAACLADVESSD